MQADSFYHYNDYPAQQIDHAIHEAQYESITFQPFMIVAGDVGTIEIDEQLITDILHKASDAYSETTDHYPPAVTTTTAQLMMVDNDTGNLRPADNPADAQYLIATMSSVIDVQKTQTSQHDLSAPVQRAMKIATETYQSTHVATQYNIDQLLKLSPRERAQKRAELQRVLTEIDHSLENDANGYT